MSKKHYISIARVLLVNKSSFKVCSDLAVQFKNDNGSFDIDRFLTACGHWYESIISLFDYTIGIPFCWYW